MKNKFLITIFCVISVVKMMSAQGFEGEIIYERTYYWVNVNQQLPYLSQEEKDRMKYTYGKRTGWSSKMKLTVSNNQTVYTNYDDETAGSDWSWREEDFVVYRDFTNRKIKELQEAFGKTYLIDEDFHTPKWKILNEIKDVAGYICMKAETYDSIKDQRIVAWFTDQIPVDSGPELMYGLPGMILELDVNSGCVIVTALSVTPKTLEQGLPLPKKWKGKKIAYDDFQALLKKHIQESIKAKRNPFWQIRY